MEMKFAWSVLKNTLNYIAFSEAEQFVSSAFGQLWRAQTSSQRSGLLILPGFIPILNGATVSFH